MGRASTLAAAVGALALGVVATHAAQAAVVSTFTNANLTTSPLTISVGGGAGSLSFTAATTGYGPGAAVATGGNAMVTTIFGQVADFGAGSSIDGTGQGLYTFASYSAPSAIQYSAADDFVGFTYIGSDGTHYGYAEVFGPTLVGYAVESTAGTAIATSQVVPEPASLALLATGVAGIGYLRRRQGGTAAA